MNKDDKALLIDQYKTYVDMSDKISQRRNQANRFYLTMLSAILALIGILQDKDVTFSNLNRVYLLVSIFSIFISIIWLINISSYRKLNTAKFRVIHKMEESLPVSPFKKEWEYLRGEKNKNKYLQLSRVESYVPVVFIIIFSIIILSILI